MTIAVVPPDDNIIAVVGGTIITIGLALAGTWCTRRAATDSRIAVRVACTPAATAAFIMGGVFISYLVDGMMRVWGPWK